MKKNSIKTLVILGAVLMISGLAFAHGRGYGGGYHMMDGYRGYHMMGGYDGYHMMDGFHRGWGNLSAEDQQKMQKQMDEFYEATKDLRAEYNQKRIALEQEYEKPEKDRAAIDRLEEQLFDLSSKLDRKRFDQMTAMRRQFGDEASGFGYGHGCF